MTDRTGKKLFLASLNKRCPRRVLSSIQLNYTGFVAHFDLPRKRHLKVSLSAYQSSEPGVLEVYETATISDQHRYTLLESNSSRIQESDPLPFLHRWLKVVIGHEGNHYQGCFAEMILAASCGDKQ